MIIKDDHADISCFRVLTKNDTVAFLLLLKGTGAKMAGKHTCLNS